MSEASILSVVEGQRESLTDKDHNCRIKAMNKINLCIKEQTLSVREVAVLTEFYRERLKDSWEVHGAVLQGMTCLAQQPKYPGSAIIRLLPTLSHELHVQSLAVDSRLACVKFFTQLFSKHSDWLNQVGPEFCNLVVQSFDGETDPRVLHNGFKLFTQLQAIGLPGDKNENLWEEVLDVCACYFPVDFEPDNTDRITREQLVDSLNAALTSGIKSNRKIPKAKHSPVIIDLLLEKLHSESKLAICDSITLLKVALPHLSREHLDARLTDLIQILVIIVGQRQEDEKAQKDVLNALQALAMSYKSHPEGAERGLDYIYELAGEFLSPPFKPALWTTVRVFAAWAASGVDVLNKCLPSLIQGLQSPASTGEALDSIVELANASQSTGSKNATLDNVLLESITNKSVSLQTKLLSISAVAACANSNLISQEGLEAITLEVFDYATKADSLEVCREASHCLSFIAEKNPDFIRDKILPQLEGKALQKDTFVLLLCQFVNLEGFMALEICQKLVNIIRDHQYDATWDDSVRAALSGLKGMVPKVKSVQVRISIAKMFLYGIMDALIQSVMYCGQDKNRKTVLMDDSSIDDICEITRFLGCCLDDDSAAEFRAELWKAFTLNGISKGQGQTKVYFKPFEPSYSYVKTQGLIIPFLTSYMCTVTPSTQPSNFNEYTEFLLRVLQNRNSQIYQVKAAAKMLAAVINKSDNIDERIWTTLQEVSAARGHSEEVLTAILLKGGKELESWVDRLLILASQAGETSRLAADAWWLLLGETADLSPETGATIKRLYPQRLFGMALPKIKKIIDEKPKGVVKENMLIILGHLLSLVPSEVQSRELPPLLPLLFEALSSTEDGLVDSALSTVTQLQANGSDEVITALLPHLDTLIDRFLRIVYSKLSLRVRCQSLQNLRSISRIKGGEIQCVRSRTFVMCELKQALNDAKRVLRREASLTMNRWCMVGEE